jgi:hypothetical protein
MDVGIRVRPFPCRPHPTALLPLRVRSRAAPPSRMLSSASAVRGAEEVPVTGIGESQKCDAGDVSSARRSFPQRAITSSCLAFRPFGCGAGGEPGPALYRDPVFAQAGRRGPLGQTLLS